MNQPDEEIQQDQQDEQTLAPLEGQSLVDNIAAQNANTKAVYTEEEFAALTTPPADADDTDDAAAQPPEVEQVEHAEAEQPVTNDTPPEGADVSAASYERNVHRQKKVDERGYY